MDTLPAPSGEHSNILIGGSSSSELDTHGCSPNVPSPVSQEQVPQKGAITQDCVAPTQLGDLVDSAVKDGRDTGINRENPDCSSILASNLPPTVQEEQPEEHPVIYVGNVKLQASSVDNIAGAFLQSSRKTLHFVPPTRQNGEVIIRPTKEVVDNGSKKWHTTAVGYFLGRRPYFPQLESFARANWKGLQHVCDIQWILFLPFPFQTDDGLNTVASGIGTPLYTDGITKNCSRLDYARVCVMLDFNSELPKHLVVISPVLRNGKEDPKMADVEYEWLPQRCTNCCSLGLVATTCPANTKRNIAPPIMIFVKKQSAKLDPVQPTQDTASAGPAAKLVCKNSAPVLSKGKEIILYNSFGALDIEGNDSQLAGPNNRSPTVEGS
ncbi:hypothetical protein Sango_3018900 [Sesamum angolense]|uniref:DUF4283 domain-containing protein n=1 Tax=Sesamum angolense TaxID=2727404 RepID=A0AAE1T3H6_9LAMI|nr:hypothetical protein Sango_3018900 [Sesamum angolense]